jgi:hypothetical protein
MESTRELQIKYVRFTAGSEQDPKPQGNLLAERFARCLTCQTVIVHWSTALKAWVDDGGHYHTRHELEFPEEWIHPQ